MKLTALFTLSDNKIVYVSKGKTYNLASDELGKFILDNTGKKIHFCEEELAYRFSHV